MINQATVKTDPAVEGKTAPETELSQKLRSHFVSQFKRLKSEGNIPELIFWIVSSALMIYTTRVMFSSDYPPALILATVLNTLATIAVPVFSMIFPQKFFPGRLSFRTQTYFDMIIISGSFFCYGFDMYRFVETYDKWQHFFSGFLVVFLGAELMKTFFPKKKVEPAFGLIGGIGLSFAIIVIWELFEFTADFFIADSTNQGYNIGMNDKYMFVKIFGHGAGNEGQYPLFDTMFDMMAATVGIVVAVLLFVIIMKIKKRKSQKKA